MIVFQINSEVTGKKKSINKVFGPSLPRKDGRKEH
jgi:hypothetical protein